MGSERNMQYNSRRVSIWKLHWRF